MEKSKNKSANNMFWYVIGLCVILITLVSVFMSANKRGVTVVNDTGETSQTVESETKEVKENASIEDAVKQVTTSETVTEKPEEKQSETLPPPSKTVVAEKAQYELPISGYIANGYSVDVPVYSITMNDYRAHTGIDIMCEEGSAVSAASSGIIKDVYNDPMMGMTVVIDHGDGVNTRYMNLSETLPENITVGAEIAHGELIGAVGSSALLEVAEDAHLHFEVTVSGALVDPLSMLDINTAEAMSDNVVE